MVQVSKVPRLCPMIRRRVLNACTTNASLTGPSPGFFSVYTLRPTKLCPSKHNEKSTRTGTRLRRVGLSRLEF
jgi:hypothetical protein